MAHIFLFANVNETAISGFVYRNLIRTGHKVSFFSPQSCKAFPEILPCPALLDVESFVARQPEKPDLIWFVESSIHPLLLPYNMLRMRIPCVWWAIDNHMNLRWHREQAGNFHLTFFAMKDYIPEANRFSQRKNIQWLPLCADPELLPSIQPTRDLDCAFVGNMNRNRERIFGALKKEAPVQTFSGKNPTQMMEIYSRAKTVVNFAIREDLNMRVFEAMAAGALLITQDINNGLYDLFEPGTHLLTHHFSDAGATINKALADDARRETTALAGMQLVRKEHTYINRIETVIQAAGQAGTFIPFTRSEAASAALVMMHRHHGQLEAAEKEIRKAGMLYFQWRRLQNFLSHIKFKMKLLTMKKV